jgi:hypothetical protein
MKGHKINEKVNMMKLNDYVKFRGKLGKIIDVRVHKLSWTTYTLFKVEFDDDNPFEWINKDYLVKV